MKTSTFGITLIIVIIIVFLIVLGINLYIFKGRNALYFNKRNWNLTNATEKTKECGN